MYIISNGVAMVLSFSDIEDLESVIERLQETANQARSNLNENKPPYFYAVFHKNVPEHEIINYLNQLKGE